MRPKSELQKITFKLAVLDEVENTLLNLVEGINLAKKNCRSWIQESDDFSYFEIKYLISEQSSKIVQHCLTIVDTINERLQNKTRLHSTKIHDFREEKNTTLQQNLKRQEDETMAKFKVDLEAKFQTLQDEMKEELSAASCFMGYLQADCQTLLNHVKEINETNKGQNEKIADTKMNASKLLAKILASQARLNEEVVKNEKCREDLESTKINIGRLTHKLGLAEDEIKKHKQEIKLLQVKTFGSEFDLFSATSTTTNCQPFIKSNIASPFYFGLNSSNPKTTFCGFGSVSTTKITTANDRVGSGLKATNTTTNSSGFGSLFATKITTSNDTVGSKLTITNTATNSSGFGPFFSNNITSNNAVGSGLKVINTTTNSSGLGSLLATKITSNDAVGSGLKATNTTTNSSGFGSLFATNITTSNDAVGSGLKATNTTTNSSRYGSLFAPTMTVSSDAKWYIPKTISFESGASSSDTIESEKKSLDFLIKSIQTSKHPIVSRTIDAFPAMSFSETKNALDCPMLARSGRSSMFSNFPWASEFPDSTSIERKKSLQAMRLLRLKPYAPVPKK